MKKQHNTHCERKFYGTVTVGEKGQIVIPNDARKAMKVKKGDRLLVFGTHKDMLAIVRLEQVEEIASHLSKKLHMIDDIIKKTK